MSAHDGLMAGKVVLVTGAGSGIGRATALLMASRGATILALDRAGEALPGLAGQIEAEGGAAFHAQADTSDVGEMRKAVGALVGDRRLDGVVANAGINGVWAPIDDLQPEEWARTMAVNLTGTYNTIHLTLPHLKRAGGGSIVIVSSINGTRIFSNAGATAYSVTKAGQLAMAQQLALELARFRIRVNAVCPGRTSTSIRSSTTRRNTQDVAIPVHRPLGDIPLTGGAGAQPIDVAEAIAFLSSDRARHITGTPIWVDGAQSLLL